MGQVWVSPGWPGSNIDQPKTGHPKNEITLRSGCICYRDAECQMPRERQVSAATPTRHNRTRRRSPGVSPATTEVAGDSMKFTGDWKHTGSTQSHPRQSQSSPENKNNHAEATNTQTERQNNQNISSRLSDLLFTNQQRWGWHVDCGPLVPFPSANGHQPSDYSRKKIEKKNILSDEERKERKRSQEGGSSFYQTLVTMLWYHIRV